MKLILRGFLFVIIATHGTNADALVCRSIFDREVHALLREPPTEQWLRWEQTANDSEWQQPNTVELPIKQVPLEQVNINVTGFVPSHIKEKLIEATHINWLVDPTNTIEGLPFEALPNVNTWKARYTMSRSKVVFTKESNHSYEGFSAKLPTNNPQKGENNKNKADLRKSVIVSLDRGRHIEAVESRIGVDPRLVILKDVMSIYDKVSGNGFVVRDISYLLNGHRFLPNFSIPFVGPAIAKANGKSYEDFFVTNYVKDLAVAKALLLIRYGLQMKYPHGQNTLKEFLPDLTPTRSMVIRDMSDTSLVEPIAEVISPEALAIDKGNQTTRMNSIELNWSNSAYQFI